MKKTYLGLKLLGLAVSIAIIIGLIGLMCIAIIYPKLPSMDDLRTYQPKLPLQVYSSDNVLLGQFGQERRIFVSYQQTPKILIDAILAAEDEHFFKHNGIDYQGVLRAFIENVISGRVKSGGSTITMQVARNFFLSSQKTYARKFNEILLAYKIEKSLSKEQILELYINQIYLGQRAYGFAEAALTYFGKPLDKLNIAQYAILAGLPKAPSAYNPVVNKKRAIEREKYVLQRMRIAGFIDDEKYKNALSENISIVKGSINDITDSGGFVAEMVRQMLYSQYGDSIYTQGYKVYTTINSKMQQAAYRAIRNGILKYENTKGYNGAEEQLNLGDNTNNDQSQLISSLFDDLTDYGDLQAAIVIDADSKHIKTALRDGQVIEFTGNSLDMVRKYINSGGNKQITHGSVIRVQNDNGKYRITQVPTVEGALVALDPNNGQIRALIGGFDYTNNNFNHVTQAKRQPGSSFKPFIYSAALDNGLSTSTIIDDSPVCYPDNGSQWCPRNDDNDFLGPISLRQALTLSRNIVTVKILNQISPSAAINYVTKFGFDRSQFQPYLTMALGANEVTPLQMASAFAVFANGGYMVQPYLIQKITDNKGNLLAQTQIINARSTQPVIDVRNAFIMNSILQDVVRYGTGARAYKELKRNDIAGKTGTTTDAKDVWFDGYTPNLVAVTWIGYDTPKSLGSHQYGANLALPIWINFMSQALANTPQTLLGMPSGIKVIAGATWKGNDEYVYDNTPSLSSISNNDDKGDNNGINSMGNMNSPNKLDSSSTMFRTSNIDKTNASIAVAKKAASTDSTNHAINNSVDNSLQNNTSNEQISKPANIDDLIKNIQD